MAQAGKNEAIAAQRSSEPFGDASDRGRGKTGGFGDAFVLDIAIKLRCGLEAVGEFFYLKRCHKVAEKPPGFVLVFERQNTGDELLVGFCAPVNIRADLLHELHGPYLCFVIHSSHTGHFSRLKYFSQLK